MLAGLKDIEIRHAHQTVVIGSADPATADFLRIGLGAPTAECRCVVIDDKGVAIYVADITYRSDVIQLHIDLLANSRAPSRRRSAPGCRPRPRERRTEASDAGLRGCDCYHPKIRIIESTVALIGSAGAERALAPASRRSCAVPSIGLE